jgi:lysophospholipase L1-like esterase
MGRRLVLAVGVAWLLVAACAPVDEADPLAATTTTTRVPGAVLVVGDSLTVGARDVGDLRGLLERDGWRAGVIARTAAALDWGLERVESLDRVPEIAVVALGTNPGPTVRGFADEVDALLDALEARGARRVLWVAPHHADGRRYDAKVRVLYDAAEARPVVRVADWGVVAEEHPEWMDDDGIHLTDRGYAALARFIRDELRAA